MKTVLLMASAISFVVASVLGIYGVALAGTEDAIVISLGLASIVGLLGAGLVVVGALYPAAVTADMIAYRSAS